MANNKKTNKVKKKSKSNTNAKTTFEKVVKKNIYKLVDELKKTQNLYRANDIVNLIQIYYEYAHMNKLNIDYPKEAEFEVNKYDFTKIEVRNNYIYNYYNLTLANDFNKKMCEINDYIKSKYITPITRGANVRVTQKETTRLVENFFKDYDEKLYKYYQSIKDTRLFKCEMDAFGDTINGFGIIDTIVLYNPTETIIDSFTVCHEIIHSYITDKTKSLNEGESLLYYANNFLEVYSIFIELAFYDYLKRIKYFNSDVDRYYKYMLCTMFEFLSEYKNSNYKNPNEQRYSYGYVLAFQFYTQYLNNKEQAKKNITNFMIDFKSRRLKEMINNYGLSENEILDPKNIERYVRGKLPSIDNKH